MRVKRSVDISYLLQVIRLESMSDIEDRVDLIAPEPPEDPNEIVNTDIFSLLKPGNELVCLMLRSEGLSYDVVGKIMDIPETHVRNIMAGIREKVLKNGLHK